jgi:hypothetical protein
MRSFAEAPTVEAFLEASLYAGALLGSDGVRLAWEVPSAVEMMTVGDLCGHMFLIVRRVGERLESATNVGGSASAMESDWTWARVETRADLNLPEHRQVRIDGAYVAAWGWEEVHNAYKSRVRMVSDLLERGLPAATEVGGHRLPFSSYLVTRVVELIVHADDLACSIGLVGTPPQVSLNTALDALVDGSRSAHGDLALLRALSRPERAPEGISVF